MEWVKVTYFRKHFSSICICFYHIYWKLYNIRLILWKWEDITFFSISKVYNDNSCFMKVVVLLTPLFWKSTKTMQVRAAVSYQAVKLKMVTHQDKVQSFPSLNEKNSENQQTKNPNPNKTNSLKQTNSATLFWTTKRKPMVSCLCRWHELMQQWKAGTSALAQQLCFLWSGKKFCLLINSKMLCWSRRFIHKISANSSLTTVPANKCCYIPQLAGVRVRI